MASLFAVSIEACIKLGTGCYSLLPPSNSHCMLFACMMHAMMQRKQTTKEDDQQFSSMPHHHGRIPTHGGGGGGGGGGGRGSKEAHQLPRLPAGAPMAPLSDMPAAEASSASAHDGSGGGGSCWVKPGCMMELARLAKIPPPASGLACPRCRSTETKFCYYNNYSLSQPRHFCKTCRRYWTHGGALRDLPFSSSSVRRRRRNNKPSNHKAQTSSKVAMAAAILHPLEKLLIGGGEHHRAAGASRPWFPGHQSSQDPLLPLGYRHRHQLGNSRAAATIRLEHQQRYVPQRQPFPLLGHKNAGSRTAAATSAIFPFISGGGGTEAAAASFAGQMHAAAISRARGSSAVVTTTELASSEMVAGNPPIIPPTEMGTTTLASSPVEYLLGVQGDHDLFHFLGSGSWAACGYGSTAGNGSGGGTSCTVAAPGSGAWPEPDTSWSSGRSTIL